MYHHIHVCCCEFAFENVSVFSTLCVRVPVCVHVCSCESVFMLCIRCHPFRFYYVCLANTMFPIQITHVWFIVHGFSFFFHSIPLNAHLQFFIQCTAVCVCLLANLFLSPVNFVCQSAPHKCLRAAHCSCICFARYNKMGCMHTYLYG